MAIESLESLRRHLEWALQVEHGTPPPFSCALYSIKQGTNAEASEVVHSVFMEEMLHVTLAANLLNAVGGEPRIDTPEMLPPSRSTCPHSNRVFEVPLRKFSPEAVETFMKIERPAEHDAVPEDDSYETIGRFYEAIEVALVRLSETLGELAVFCGDPGRQITDELYYGGSGRIIAVDGLGSGLAALGEIVEQGERARPCARVGRRP
jgi:Ferritin-like